MLYFLLFAVSFIVTYLVTPPIRNIALRYDVVDRREQRKIHRKVITKLGGLGIFCGFSIALLLAFIFEYSIIRPQYMTFGAMLVGAVIILCLGLYDDVRGADAFVKFSTQLIVATILIKADLIISEIKCPWGIVSLGFLSIPITLFVIVGIINAINLIDGLDGLAAGIGGIALIMLFTISAIKYQNTFVAITSIALAGAVFGFLKYNFYPAKLFMGDTGSLFLGYIIAVLVIHACSFEKGSVNVFVPLLTLGIPILDTLFAIVRRIFLRKNPFRADNSHVHHWLLRHGYSHRDSVLVLYLVTICLTTGAFIIAIV